MGVKVGAGDTASGNGVGEMLGGAGDSVSSAAAVGSGVGAGDWTCWVSRGAGVWSELSGSLGSHAATTTRSVRHAKSRLTATVLASLKTAGTCAEQEAHSSAGCGDDRSSPQRVGASRRGVVWGSNDRHVRAAIALDR